MRTAAAATAGMATAIVMHAGAIRMELAARPTALVGLSMSCGMTSLLWFSLGAPEPPVVMIVLGVIEALDLGRPPDTKRPDGPLNPVCAVAEPAARVIGTRLAMAGMVEVTTNPHVENMRIKP